MKQESISKLKELSLSRIASVVVWANTRPALQLPREQHAKTAQLEPFPFLWELRLKPHVVNVQQASMQQLQERGPALPANLVWQEPFLMRRARNLANFAQKVSFRQCGLPYQLSFARVAMLASISNWRVVLLIQTANFATLASIVQDPRQRASSVLRAHTRIWQEPHHPTTVFRVLQANILLSMPQLVAQIVMWAHSQPLWALRRLHHVINVEQVNT